METNWMSTDRWMDKEGMINIYDGLLLSHKKEWNNVICSNMDGPRDYPTEWSKSDRQRKVSYAATWMDLEIILLSEVSQKEKGKYQDITYMWNLKYNTNKLIYKTETDWQK